MGYFPTYTLGNLLAAQFMERARAEPPHLDEACRRGDFSTLKGWLVNHIHRHGQRYRTAELCRLVTGHDLSAQPLLRHLRGKFVPLYRG